MADLTEFVAFHTADLRAQRDRALAIAHELRTALATAMELLDRVNDADWFTDDEVSAAVDAGKRALAVTG